jgi:hypothetical protein
MQPLSRKQQIYVDIIDALLPFARNVETWPRWRRIFRVSLFPELELIHNIPPLLRASDIQIYDVHWLNTQARSYVSACQASERVSGDYIQDQICELISLVPDHLRSELLWSGPPEHKGSSPQRPFGER